MTDAKYTTTLQPISVYGYRIATVTVLEAGTANTTVTFDRPVKVLAKLTEGAVTTGTTATITAYTPAAGDTPASGDAAGTKLYFLVQ